MLTSSQDGPTFCFDTCTHQSCTAAGKAALFPAALVQRCTSVGWCCILAALSKWIIHRKVKSASWSKKLKKNLSSQPFALSLKGWEMGVQLISVFSLSWAPSDNLNVSCHHQNLFLQGLEQTVSSFQSSPISLSFLLSSSNLQSIFSVLNAGIHGFSSFFYGATPWNFLLFQFLMVSNRSSRAVKLGSSLKIFSFPYINCLVTWSWQSFWSFPLSTMSPAHQVLPALCY